MASTALITSHIAQKTSQPAHEGAFMDSYANAAVATFESGKHQALLKWLDNIGLSRHMALFLLSSTGEIIGSNTPPDKVKEAAQQLRKNQFPNSGIFKFGTLTVSHEIISHTGIVYRLAAVSERPLSAFVKIPWTGLTIMLIVSTIISGLICYILSLYLTRPLRSLSSAVKSITTGKLNTRVGPIKGHSNDEIAKLSTDFDRMAAELENIIRSKERLLQDISHELRSPLTRLNIAIELGRQKTNQLAEVEFNRMETECARLNFLIGEILEFARLEKSTTEIKLEKINIKNLLLEIINDGNFESKRYSKRIIAEMDSDCEIKIDCRLLHRALENVVRNALHYTPKDKKIFISLFKKLEDKAVYIKIMDEGPGVPEEQLEKIFNPFYRVDSSRTKKTGGYGLGLAITFRAIELHQGTISAINSKSGGLLIQIRLPICN